MRYRRFIDWLLPVTDLLLAIMSFYAWWFMMTFYYGALFTDQGIRTLRYFTVDSNLFLAIALLICLVPDLKALKGAPRPRWAGYLRLSGVVGTSITFLVVLCFLGPVFGFHGMYSESSLYFHLLIPVFAFLIFVLSRSVRPLPFWPSVAFGMIPMVVYGFYYGGNLLLNGLEGPYGSNDWYGFLNGDMNRYPIALLILVLFDFLLSMLITWVGTVRVKTSDKQERVPES